MHRLWLAWLFSLVAAGGLAAAEAYTGWLKLSTPEFVVLTPLRKDEAVAWAAEFAQYVAALRNYFKAEDRKLPPLTFVVFAREVDFDGYRPVGPDGRTKQVGAFFVRHETWAVAGTGGTRLPVQMRRTIFHEGVHWFMSTADVPNPIWLEEGLAEVFSTFEINEGRAEWGQSIEDHVRLLRSQGLMPLERLLFTGREELFGTDLSHTGKVYAQSWAYAHYLVFGVHKIAPTAITDYGAFTQSGVGPAEAFRQAFGKPYREMDDELKRYIGSGNYYLNRMPLVAFSPPRIEDATRFEVQDGLARLALGARRAELAATHGRAAVTANPADPRGHEVLGLALKQLGDQPGALAEFALADERGTTDAQVHFDLAVAEQRNPAEPLRPSSARRVANRYIRAVTLFPRIRSAYQNLAGVVGLAEPVGPEDRRVLEAGKKMWPDDAQIEVGLAILTHRAGDPAAARAQLDRVLAGQAADAAPARAFARRLLDGWEQQEIVTEINRLASAQKLAEALAYADERLARGVSPANRPQLLTMKATLTEGLTAQKIDQALRGRRWAEARRLLTESLQGEGPAAMKAQARRTLDDLDRQGLGLEPAEK
ncbi:MAG: DUF1570 domain-containing protein [Verrucomicrobia bacterium]|nr:DUF1570 domain-containing protein [Verrucomicrobiota bacterium]